MIESFLLVWAFLNTKLTGDVLFRDGTSLRFVSVFRKANPLLSPQEVIFYAG
jgi:hypothetical protein